MQVQLVGRVTMGTTVGPQAVQRQVQYFSLNGLQQTPVTLNRKKWVWMDGWLDEDG